jgi:hypothetical protein
MVLLTGSVPLLCHPRTPLRAVHAVEAVAGSTPGGRLILTYALQGDLSAVRIPGRRPSRRADGLWRHTCFEAFVMAGEGPGYREFNFSPSGEWAAFAFRGYRDGGEPEGEPAREIVVRRSRGRLALDVEIRPECLPPGRLLRLALSAVVEGADGTLSYWALRHPASQPDFHHGDAFALPLVLPSMPAADDHTRGTRS